jgi:tRNA1Val (adenine37-N6)-methyltransferase
VHLTCLELQKNLIALIHKNIELNGFEQRLAVLEGDLVQLKTLLPAESFDRVVCNPPYGKLGAGRKNSGSEQAVARHELRATLADVVDASFFALKNKGRAAFIYPASRAAILLTELKGRGLEPKRLRIVYSYPASVAKLVLVEAMKGGGEELEIAPPFFIYEEPGGDYTKEMRQCYAG